MGVQAAMGSTIKSVGVSRVGGGGGVGRMGARGGGTLRGGGVVSARASYGTRPQIFRLSRGAAAFTGSSSNSGASHTLVIRCTSDETSSTGGSSGGEMSESSSVQAGPTDDPFRFPNTDFLTGGGDDGPIGNQAEAIVKGNSAAVVGRCTR
jgi:hypothetical protein